MSESQTSNPYPKGTPKAIVWDQQHGITTNTPAPPATPPPVQAVDPNALLLLDKQNTTNSNSNNTSYTSGVVQNIDNTQRSTINTQGTNSNGTDINNTTTRKYLDIPTPDEFLDDFRTGFSTYITDQMRAGSIGGPQATWLMQNEALFLGNYLGKLGDMARSGQQIFRPVGMNANNQYLGDRQGNVTSGVNTQTNTAKTTGTQTTLDTGGGYQGIVKNGTDVINGGNITNTQTGGPPPYEAPWYNKNAPPFAPVTEGVTTGQVQGNNVNAEMSLGAPVTQSNGQGGGEVQGGQFAGELDSGEYQTTVGPRLPPNGVTNTPSPLLTGLNTTNYNNNQGNQTTQNMSDINTINNNTNTNKISDIKNTTGTTTSSGNQTEQLYSRNNLAYVKSLSPYDYLSSSFTPGALGVMYEGMKNQPRFSETGVSQPKLQVGGV